MKHSFLLAAVGSLFLASCSSEPSFKLVGTSPVDVPDGGMVYLRNVDGAVLDSTVLKNHQFVFEGRQDQVVQGWITYKKEDKSFRGIVFLENSEMNLSYEGGDCKVTGTATNDLYYDFMNRYKQANEAMRVAYQKYKDEKTSEEERTKLGDEIHQMNLDCQKMVAQTITENIQNPVGVSLVMNFGYQYPETQQKEWILQVPESLRPKYMNEMIERFTRMEKTAVGKKFLDFTMQTPEGKDVKLSEFVAKNKYTLLDFWASWCGPCRADMPNIVKAYQKHHKKGFGIISVSLDNDAKRWTKAIEDLKMTWDHMSDLKAWDCAGSKMYGVGGIPATVLIANDGTIIARDLHGKELDEKLEELLK